MSEFSQRTGKVMDALEENGDTIKSSIPNWYPYELNYSQSDGYRLYDRGLYEEDGGNRVREIDSKNIFAPKVRLPTTYFRCIFKKWTRSNSDLRHKVPLAVGHTFLFSPASVTWYF